MSPPQPANAIALFKRGGQSVSFPLPAGTWRGLASSETLSGTTSLAGYAWRYLERQ